MKAGEIVEERPIATESVHNGTLLIRIEVGVVAVDGGHDCVFFQWREVLDLVPRFELNH